MARRTTTHKTARWRMGRPQKRSANCSRWGGSFYRRPLRLEALEDRRLLAVVTVDTLDDTVDLADGVTSLREAIFATNTVEGEDTIRFDPALTAAGPATIQLTKGELQITDSLTIEGPGADRLTVDASGNDPTPGDDNGDGSRIFTVNDQDISSFMDVTIRGMTLSGGDVGLGNDSLKYYGGAIVNLENLHVEDVVAAGNRALIGGALHNETGTLWVVNSTVSENVAEEFGGGIYSVHGDTFVEDSVIKNNIARQPNVGGGGGIRSYLGNLSVINSTITGNTSGLHGGGIAVRKGNLYVRQTAISGNKAEFEGGGIHVL